MPKLMDNGNDVFCLRQATVPTIITVMTIGRLERHGQKFSISPVLMLSAWTQARITPSPFRSWTQNPHLYPHVANFWRQTPDET